MPDSEHLTDDLTAGARFAPSVPARHEPFPLKGCGALDWGMQSRLARVFRPDTRRTVMLAIDHGYFQGPTTGLERVDLSILPLLPYADALMTTRGMVRSTVPPASRVPIVLRASGGPSVLGLRASLHRTEVHPGEVYVAHAGVPHYLGPRLSFIEVQEPSDHIVIPETSGEDDRGATMGLGWDLALDMIDYGTADAASTLARARQQQRVLRTSHGSREVRLFAGDVAEFFDATVLEVADEIEVADGRFSIAIVTAGDGWTEGDFGRQPVRKGQTFAWPASLSLRVHAGREPVRVVRCLGPATR